MPRPRGARRNGQAAGLNALFMGGYDARMARFSPAGPFYDGPMSQRVVYFNGRFVPEAQTRLSIYDSALVMGDMAFEVTRTVHGRPFRLDDHLTRLYHTLAALRIDPGLSRAELRAISEEVLARNLPTEPADVDWNIIHNILRGPVAALRDAFSPDELRPTVIVSCFPLVEKLGSLAAAYESGIDLVVPAQRSLPGGLLDDSLKTRSRLHYQLANLQAAEMAPRLGRDARSGRPSNRRHERQHIHRRPRQTVDAPSRESVARTYAAHGDRAGGGARDRLPRGRSGA